MAVIILQLKRLRALSFLIGQCPQPMLIFFARSCSETDERPKREPQVAVCAVAKIHFIRDVEAQAHGT